VSARRIRAIRRKFNLTQGEFGQLLNLHGVSVSKLERGTVKPRPFQAALLVAFEEATLGDAVNTRSHLMNGDLACALRRALAGAQEAE